MKFELSDENVLTLSAVGCGLYAGHAVVSPRGFQDTWMEKTQVSNDTAWRWFGMALGNVSAAGLVIARCEPDKKLMKNYLKTSGVGWLAASAHTVYLANEGIQKRELSLASAAGQAVVGALCLWRGFKDDEVAGVATPKF